MFIVDMQPHCCYVALHVWFTRTILDSSVGESVKYDKKPNTTLEYISMVHFKTLLTNFNTPHFRHSLQ